MTSAVFSSKEVTHPSKPAAAAAGGGGGGSGGAAVSTHAALDEPANQFDEPEPAATFDAGGAAAAVPAESKMSSLMPPMNEDDQADAVREAVGARPPQRFSPHDCVRD